jgi:hypothetical protein
MKPMTKPHQLRLLGCAAALLAASALCNAASEERLYRYKNDKGVTAIDDHVPPEFVKNGYDVLTRDLRVIETVPRQLTGAEGKRQRAAADAARKQAEWDKRLLLRYSNPVDIEEARDRALAEFDVRISILQSNLRSIRSQIEAEQARAADMERRGQPVPEAVTRNIAALKKEIAFTEDSVAQRRKEKEATRTSFQNDIERFKVLNPLVEMRRKAAQSEEETGPETGK